ncbi:MAG: TrmH family RNA methyltransferase [Candidatus Gracilibacteria bacterium]|nr:TrmH family RNA methyltransferase [Candidatus Gracilibacteria bacterium]
MIKHFAVVLPDIRSGFNVGAFFRTADGLGVDHVYLSGYTPYPPHKEISKTALGADDFVEWTYYMETGDLLEYLKQEGYFFISLEKIQGSKPLGKFEFQDQEKICLILGNEIEGVSEDILKISDEILEIEMKGRKESFNVSVAGSIAMYQLLLKGQKIGLFWKI